MKEEPTVREMAAAELPKLLKRRQRNTVFRMVSAGVALLPTLYISLINPGPSPYRSGPDAGYHGIAVMVAFLYASPIILLGALLFIYSFIRIRRVNNDIKLYQSITSR
jgi:hypothetical protein